MNEELESQDKQLEDLQGHAETTLNNINEVEATTRRDFKLREAEGETQGQGCAGCCQHSSIVMCVHAVQLRL